MTLAAPRFSVVIPSRNRPETLPVTLRTVLAQDFDDYEVLVVDNASDVDLQPITDSFNEPRIRYTRQPRALAMTDNWNHALGLAQGDWILFLGDDDGLCRGALSTIDRLAREYPVRSMRWDWGRYAWPDMPDEQLRNRLGIPLFGETQLRSYPAVVKAMILQDANAELPFVYHAAVERSLIEQAVQTGPVFAGPIPDLHSGILFSTIDEHFLHVGVPLTITAWSGKSNTVAQIAEDAPDATSRDFDRLNVAGGHLVHPELPDLVANRYVAWWDPVLRVRDRLSLTADYLFPSTQDAAQGALNQLYSSGAQRDDEIGLVVAFAQSRGVEADSLEIPTVPAPRPEMFPFEGRPCLADTLLVLDTFEHGVLDVDAACELLARAMDLHDGFRLVRESGQRATAQAWAEHGRAQEALNGALATLQEVQAQNADLADRLEAAQKRLHYMENSLSWRFTKLLRVRPGRR